MSRIEELALKKAAALAGGGSENIHAQHNMNKMTSRERINFLLDEGSFTELDTMADGNGAGVIIGYGTINERLVYIYSEDFTIDGGLIGVKSSKKIVHIMNMALKMGAPLIQIIDSSGVKLNDDGLGLLGEYSKLINMNAKLSGVVPQIAVVAGPCTGLSAISAAMSDLTIIAENCGEIYMSSPESIEEAKGSYVESNMYADAKNSVVNGSVQLAAKDDKAALELTKKLLDYLPSNNIEYTPIFKSCELVNLSNKDLDNKISSGKVEANEIIKLITDNDSIVEFDKYLSESVITTLARINGLTVGIVANNKGVNRGIIDTKTCAKITKFVKFCNSFNISLVTLVDTAGFAADVTEEQNGLALAAAKMIYSLSEANVPKLAIIIGEAYGSAYISLASKDTAFDVTYAWPDAIIALTSPEIIVKSLNKDEIVSSETPKIKQKELIEKYIEEKANSFHATETGAIDDVILPSETAAKLFMTLDMLQSKRVIKYPKKHGSVLI